MTGFPLNERSHLTGGFKGLNDLGFVLSWSS